MYEGKTIKCKKLDNGIAELILSAPKVNVLNVATLKELGEAVELVKKDSSCKGLLITSANRDIFIAGADVTEFTGYMKMGDKDLEEFFLSTHRIFNMIEDLDIPSVVAINGACMGGGCELSLSATYRVGSTKAKLGLPETKLGIFPGWGGTVRLPRLIGADNAIEWIAGGTANRADVALKVGAFDAVVADENLRDTALALMDRAIKGELDWKARREEKVQPLKINKVEAGMIFEGAKGFILGKAGPNYPAPIMAVDVMQRAAGMNRDDAIQVEVKDMCKVIKTPAAKSLVGIFLGDQYLGQVSRKITKGAAKINKAAVIGAGIMGGGIAYQSAFTKTPIVMKDIREDALELGMGEAGKILGKRVKRGKMKDTDMIASLARIRPTLGNDELKDVDIVVEAVVENVKIKGAVLRELEDITKDGAIITSNTSTISINELAKNMKHPENFCGMHFFNPVPIMPLVEVIRGEKTSDAAVAATVAYALSMKKKPIVVNDCPGFLVNRILFPYLAGFSKLISDGVDFQKIDKVMTKFGWPMGPAYLADVVGIDTAYHAAEIIGNGFPDRLKFTEKTATQVLFENDRFGQKNGKGFYKYEMDKRGKPKKKADPEAMKVLASFYGTINDSIADQEIVERMMLPMIFESSRCLEDNIVNTPMEVDMGLVYGVGFPPFRGGALMYADAIGAKNLVEISKKYEGLGNLYVPTKQIVAMADKGETFYKM